MTSCTACAAPLAADARYCQRCGSAAGGDFAPVSTPAATGSAPAVTSPSTQPNRTIIVDDDSWFGHLLRMIGVGTAMSVAFYACFAGLFWQAHMLSVTGYRKRDLLMLFIPVWGGIVETRCLWRYSARQVYWSQREDRPSDLLRGWQRPASIALGWLAIPIMLVGTVALAAFSEGWTTEQRESEIESLVGAGYTRADATCIVDEIEEDVPSYAGGSESEFAAAFEEAFATCVGPAG